METTARTVRKPIEAQILSQLAASIEAAIDLWIDQERRVTVKEVRAWQAVVRDVALRLTEKGS